MPRLLSSDISINKELYFPRKNHFNPVKKKVKTKLNIFLFVLLTGITFTTYSQTVEKIAISLSGNIYLNPNTGSDTNTGTKDNPLKSLSEAAKRVTNAIGSGAITIYLSKGVYALTETADFNPNKWVFTKENPLTIRAEVLPDDKNWNPKDMPIIVSTMPFDIESNKAGKVTGGQNFGILIQHSNVTIQGLRILGEPVHENPSEGILIRNYPIVWEGDNLENLRITQCLFIGDKVALPNHLGILANGKGLEVDHCVFYGVKDCVVMWNSPATDCKMHHNLILNTYGAAVWTWSTTKDFKFYNNVISNANVIWIFDEEEKETFTIKNSMFVGFNEFVNKGGGPQGFGEKGNAKKLKIKKDVVLKKEGQLDIIDDQTSKYYLHIKQGTPGSEYGAGLFYN